MSTVTRYFEALAQRDWAGMAACYSDHAHFSDPVFPDLDATGVRAMWKMLLTSGTDLRVTYRVLDESETRAKGEWQADYTFSRTGRNVRNIISSEFELRDGLIVRQCDHFDFWRWSRQALGVPGLLLGWTSLVQNKVQRTAHTTLDRSMR
ncbi:MAG: nuclear transport factor 2 family protein [Flavobacteriales bacterium]|nr:nuclear transport factor 2 family protein [Flavobacteriales bacterium]MCC6936591.1 nuclear transport factor 2 family protein [Flavobacteriales bacterium]